MNTFELLTLVMAAIGCAGGIVATVIAIKAEKRATRAEENAAKAEMAVDAANVREVWSRLTNAAQHLIGINVIGHDMHPVFVDVRSAMTELIDHPSSVGYQHLDQWLNNEHKLINGHFELAKSKVPGRMMTAEQFAEAHYPAIDCVDRLISNLRLVRLGLVKGDLDTQFSELAVSAKEQLEDLKLENPRLIPPDPREQGRS